jgi:hypothetical protein
MIGEPDPCDECDATGEDGCGNPCPACTGEGWVYRVRDPDSHDGEVLTMTGRDYRRWRREEENGLRYVPEL